MITVRNVHLEDNVLFVKRYRHYRTGKIMDAEDYGYKAWPFGPKKKK